MSNDMSCMWVGIAKKDHFLCEEIMVCPLGDFHHVLQCCAAAEYSHYCPATEEIKGKNILCNQNCYQKHFLTNCKVLKYFFMGKCGMITIPQFCPQCYSEVSIHILFLVMWVGNLQLYHFIHLQKWFQFLYTCSTIICNENLNQLENHTCDGRKDGFDMSKYYN
jgi:hypothetical protein